ncbi:MAG: c-type cytochrome domain-containing protein, partial [Verrucomicrobiota bacterium]
MSIRSRFVFVWCFLVCGSTRLFAVESSDGLPEVVSYHQHVRPVFQAKCQGCHQPAKRKGDYVMTDVAALIAGGESGAAIVPGQTAASYLLELVVTQQGEERPEMPPKDAPLTDYEVSLVNRWIEQGATDDTPENVLDQYSRENPPEYTVPPLITSIDFSPDGQHIAVSGFHEVLIHKADGSGLEQRLIGLSERIETVAFSPDGSQLLVAGGS